MQKIYEIIKVLGVQLLSQIVVLATKVVDYLTLCKKQKIQQQEEAKIQDDNDKLKDICDNGTLKDLVNKCLFVSFIMFASGCVKTPSVNLQTTNAWEGHYMTVEDFMANTSGITLGKKESIWVLSNNTLYRLLEKKNETRDVNLNEIDEREIIR